jgi:hypothetical protein
VISAVITVQQNTKHVATEYNVERYPRTVGLAHLREQRCHYVLELLLVSPNEHDESEHKEGAGTGAAAEHDDSVQL